MRPEIEAKYRRTIQEWRRHASGFPQPLPFEVPEESRRRVSVGDMGFFDSPFMDEHRLFAGNPGGARAKLMSAMVLSGILAAGFLFLTVLVPTDTWAGIPNWMATLILTGFALSAYLLRLRWPRKANFIFDRDTGMLYIPNGPRGEHVGVDFYRQYFFIGKGMVDAVDFAGLSFFVRDGLGQGEAFSHPIRFYNVNDEEEALEGWYFLVRYMDKEWPFTEEDREFFEYERKLRKRLGVRIQGVRYADGRVEIADKPMSRIRFPRLERALAEFNAMGIFMFLGAFCAGGLYFVAGLLLILTDTSFYKVVMGRIVGDWLLLYVIWAPIAAATLIFLWHLFCAVRTFINYERIVKANEQRPALGMDP